MAEGQKNPQWVVQLNPNGVAYPAQRAAEVCKEVVDLYFAALAKQDLSKKPDSAVAKFTNFGFVGNNLTAEQRRSLHENWILSKAFQDLMRGVRLSLEEAYFSCELLSAGTIAARSNSTLEEVLQPFRKRANDLNFPELLKAVNLRLEKPLEFSEAYQSMQAARNCLEHRNGRVGTSDLNADGRMVLQFPRFMMFVERDGRTFEIDGPFHVEAGEAISVKIELRRREFRLGSALVLTAQDFDEISFACHQFGALLAGRLPKPSNDASQTQ